MHHQNNFNTMVQIIQSTIFETNSKQSNNHINSNNEISRTLDILEFDLYDIEKRRSKDESILIQRWIVIFEF